MNTDFDNDYKHALKLTSNDHIAAAILVLAEKVSVTNMHLKDFDHQICMGIRWGLFGSYSSTNSSILNLNDPE